jgi:hypothetical protein
MAIRKNPKSTLESYLCTMPGKKDMFEFEDHPKAYAFGHQLRENVAKEQGVDCWEDCEGISIDIAEKVVRIKVLAQEPACV